MKEKRIFENMIQYLQRNYPPHRKVCTDKILLGDMPDIHTHHFLKALFHNIQ